MKLPCRQFLHLATVAAALTIFSVMLANHGVWSQTARTIKIVVPAPPGAVADILARLLTMQISSTQGATLVVENRPGAGDVIGTEAVARATPDGNTLLVVGTNFVITPQMRKANYDPLNSFEPICRLANAPTIIVVNSASPYRTLAELLDAARAQPGKLTLASIGPGSVFHLGFEMLKRAAKVDMTFVPYSGNAPALNAVLGQQVTAMFGTYSNVAEYLKAGTLRALAVATPTRAEPLPDVPTVAESGFKDFEVDVWFGAFAPSNTPKEVVAQLAGWFTAAMQDAELRAKLVTQGIYPSGPCGAEFATYIRRQYDDYGRIIREANINAE
jgi:tripartite-type tricarboxylate transporter receptor subunit TctC